jgi:hypothetical protein
MLKNWLIVGVCAAVIARIATYSEDAWAPIIALWVCLLGLLVVSYRDALADWRSGRPLYAHPHLRYGLLLAAVLALVSGRLTDGPQPVSGWVFALGLLSFLVLSVMARFAAREVSG